MKGQGVAKNKKLKVPKKVAGVKVPKKVRKTAKRALAMADNPIALDFAVGALSAAAAALASSRGTREVAGEAARGPRRAAGDAGETLGREAAQLREVLRAAALEGARRLLQGLEADGRRPPPGETKAAETA